MPHNTRKPMKKSEPSIVSNPNKKSEPYDVRNPDIDSEPLKLSNPLLKSGPRCPRKPRHESGSPRDRKPMWVSELTVSDDAQPEDATPSLISFSAFSTHPPKRPASAFA